MPTLVQSDNLDSSISQNEKRKKSEVQIEPSRSQRARKENALNPQFISFQATVFLVKGDRNIILNKIPIICNIEDDPKTLVK